MKFTDEELDFLRREYKTLPLKELTKAFNTQFNANRTVGSIRACTKNHKITSGRTGRFGKGSMPWNTGTKGATGANSGSFKKGNQLPNQNPLGHERVCTKDGYILIKVAETNPYTGGPTRYRHKHQVIWEQAHGPIPKGHVVIFKDGDKRNFDIDNLQVIKRNQLCRYNQAGINELPKELIPTMREVVNLQMKVAELEKSES